MMLGPKTVKQMIKNRVMVSIKNSESAGTDIDSHTSPNLFGTSDTDSFGNLCSSNNGGIW